MNTQNRQLHRQACWWQLSLLAPLMAGLLLIDVHMKLSTLEHQTIEVGVMLLMYGAMAYWLWINQAALESASNEEQASQPASIADWQAPIASECWLIEPAMSEPLPLDEPAWPVTELEQVLGRLELHCTPPSGARLN